MTSIGKGEIPQVDSHEENCYVWNYSGELVLSRPAKPEGLEIDYDPAAYRILRTKKSME